MTGSTASSSSSLGTRMSRSLFDNNVNFDFLNNFTKLFNNINYLLSI